VLPLTVRFSGVRVLAASVLAALAAWTAWGPRAAAQSPYALDVQRLHPSALADSGLATEGGPGLFEWTFSFASALHYGGTPLRVVDRRTSPPRSTVVLDHQLVLEPAIALGLPAGFAFQFSWPLVLTAGDTMDAREITRATLRGAGIGDPRLQLSWRLSPTEGFRILASATVSIPTTGSGQGVWAELGSERSASLSGLLGAEGRIAILVLRGNVGVRGRFGDARFVLTSLGQEFRVGSELTVAGAVEVRPIPEFQALVEVHGSTTFEGFGQASRTPLELIAGLRIHPLTDFEILPFGGVGLTEGYGTPAWRFGLHLRLYLHVHDEDGDGVEDGSDRCPGRSEDRDGFQDDDGCPDPDNDGDGVPDAQDNCPTQPGLGQFGGCPDPDSDHDGIGDGDRCPELAEDEDHFEDEDGCPEPDNDRDGILDGNDRCPNQSEDRDGFQDEDGCPEPDNDRDGIPDAQDTCPREPEDRDGFEDSDGCAETDNDGDGVPDVDDGPPDPGGHFGVCRNLPETPGGRDAHDPDGCPDSAVRVDVTARRIRVPPVFFDTNADVIQERSFADLQYVAEILAANSWIRRLTVEGHTDDRGTDEYNLDLSRRRAASVVRFLVEHGVDPSRLRPEGYGRSRPPTVDDDPACRNPRSAACRQAARRVVFRIAEIATDEEAPPAPAPAPR
jgi:outer membrane protein OmpA-like peptidoglycan-associated protein